MQTVNEIIKSGGLSYSFKEISRPYLQTTENIKDYLDKFDVKEKDVLTVCASGDQALSLISLGAKNITCFDINRLSRCVLELKKNLVRNLEIDEYMNFFNKEDKLFLSNKVYNKIKNNLDIESKEFYDYLFNNFNSDDIINNFFIAYLEKTEYIKNYLTYYDEDKYYILKDNIENVDVKFINSDIYDLSSKLDQEYDLMLFSNITDYIINNEIDLKTYREYLEQLKIYLKKYGYIQIGYIYNMFHDGDHHGTYFSFKKNRDKYIKSNDEVIFITNQLKGYNEFTIDGAITLMKTK